MNYGIVFTKKLVETRCLRRPHKIILPIAFGTGFASGACCDALTCCLGTRFARFWNRVSISHSLCSVLLQAFRADEWELFLRGPGTEGSTGDESERTDQKRVRERDPARQQCSVTIRESFSCDDFRIVSEIRTSHQLNTWPQERVTFPWQFRAGTSRTPIRPFQPPLTPLLPYSQHAFLSVPVSWCCYSGYHVCLKPCARCLWPRCMKRQTA